MIAQLSPVSPTQNAELQRLRAYRDQVDELLQAAWKNKPAAKIAAIGLLTEASKQPDCSGSHIELSLTTSDVATRYSMNESTAQNALSLLKAIGLIQRVKESYPCDRQRNPVDPKLAHEIAHHNPKAIHYESSSIIAFPKRIPRDVLTSPVMAEPSTTPRNTKERTRRQEERAKLTDIACPNCGNMGGWVCKECGYDCSLDACVQVAYNEQMIAKDSISAAHLLTNVDILEPENLKKPEIAPHVQVAHDHDQQAQPARMLANVSISESENLTKPNILGAHVQLAHGITIDVEIPHNEGNKDNNPPLTCAEIIPFPVQPIATHANVLNWLLHRIGKDTRIIEQTGKPDYAHKYVEIVGDPDIEAYLTGQIVYGSRMRLEHGLTYFLTYDFDDTGYALPEQAGRELINAGIPSMVFKRGDGAHLEVTFSEPVDADRAHEYLLTLAPSLASAKECYPCTGNGKDWKKSDVRAVSWPFTRKVKDEVISCPMVAYLAPANTIYADLGWLDQPGAVKRALAACIIPASLIPAKPEPAAETPDDIWGGVIAPLPPDGANSLFSTDNPELKAKIHAWCLAHQASVKNLLDWTVKHDGSMYSIRDDDKTPSAELQTHADGRLIWHDYGVAHTWDALDVYMIRHNLSKREALRMVGKWYRETRVAT